VLTCSEQVYVVGSAIASLQRASQVREELVMDLTGAVGGLAGDLTALYPALAS